MALAFARTRWFTSSVLLGATSVQQIQENLDNAEVTQPADVLEKIEAVHRLYPIPARDGLHVGCAVRTMVHEMHPTPLRVFPRVITLASSIWHIVALMCYSKRVL